MNNLFIYLQKCECKKWDNKRVNRDVFFIYLFQPGINNPEITIPTKERDKLISILIITPELSYSEVANQTTK